MTGPRPGAPGATRTCPHCRATILESSSVCPACRHHLRSAPSGTGKRTAAAIASPLRVTGTIKQPAGASPAEYSVVVTISNDRGEEVARHIVGVGALQPEESRTFALTVELIASG